MGTRGAGNPDILFLENQSSQEKYTLQVLSVFVGKVLLFSLVLFEWTPSGLWGYESEKGRHRTLECTFQMGQGELPLFPSLLVIQLGKPTAAAAASGSAICRWLGECFREA